MPTPTKTPARPEIERPPCPGCPDPDNARRVDAPCTGPDTIEDPLSVDYEKALKEVYKSIGAPACADIVVCPRTHGSRIAPPK